MFIFKKSRLILGDKKTLKPNAQQLFTIGQCIDHRCGIAQFFLSKYKMYCQIIIQFEDSILFK